MQITIVQAEIETAIRNYIGSIMEIREGTEWDIEFMATRGAEGLKATVNLNQEGGSNRTEKLDIQKQASEAKTSEETKPTRGRPRAQQNTVKTESVTATVEEAEQVGQAEETAEISKSDPQPEAALVETPEAAPEEGKRQSLFSGLKKPING